MPLNRILSCGIKGFGLTLRTWTTVKATQGLGSDCRLTRKLMLKIMLSSPKQDPWESDFEIWVIASASRRTSLFAALCQVSILHPSMLCDVGQRPLFIVYESSTHDFIRVLTSSDRLGNLIMRMLTVHFQGITVEVYNDPGEYITYSTYG